jgi:hypothetical protein
MLSGTFSANNDTWAGEWFFMNQLSTGLQTGLDTEPGIHSDAEWYLQAWLAENTTEAVTVFMNKGKLSTLDSLPVIIAQQQVTANLPVLQPQMDADTELTDIIPAGAKLIYVAVSFSGTTGLNIGTTPGGSNILTNYTPGLHIKTIEVNVIYSLDSPTSLYFWASDWSGGGINVSVKTEQVF